MQMHVLEAKARKYASQSLTVGERDDVSALLVKRYIQGFMQGYSVAGGIISAAEADNELRCSDCGYTEEDAKLHGDHHLCAGAIPGPKLRTSSGASDAPTEADEAAKQGASTK